MQTNDLLRMIDEANGEPDPVLCNLKITLAHRALSERLRALIGAETGANFHSWAVWGSKKAGVTIRQEDLDGALQDASRVAGAVGLVVGLACTYGLLVLARGGVTSAALALWFLPGAALGTFLGPQAGRALARYSRRRAAELVLAGNRLVLDDIGRQTARFCETFEGRDFTPDAVERFVAEMDGRRAEEGGQALLQRAFRAYARAAVAQDPREKHEATYFGNCLAILNEHIKLQPYIEGSMPFIVQKCVTERMLCFDIGPLQLAVSHDVPPLAGREFPPTLESLTDAELVRFLDGPGGYSRRKDSLTGSRAGNWTRLRDRMGYIVNLFRCFHLDASVLAAPYPDAAARDILDGRVPAARL
jgi:hypothetical protein